jgi:hypothetical protein
MFTEATNGRTPLPRSCSTSAFASIPANPIRRRPGLALSTPRVILPGDHRLTSLHEGDSGSLLLLRGKLCQLGKVALPCGPEVAKLGARPFVECRKAFDTTCLAPGDETSGCRRENRNHQRQRLQQSRSNAQQNRTDVEDVNRDSQGIAGGYVALCRGLVVLDLVIEAGAEVVVDGVGLEFLASLALRHWRRRALCARITFLL